jgi:hypothetical protein
VGNAWGLLLHSRDGVNFLSSFLFSLLSLSFLSLDASSLGCFQPYWFFQIPFPSFGVVGALYVVWVSFTWGYFLLEPFFPVTWHILTAK